MALAYYALDVILLVLAFDAKRHNNASIFWQDEKQTASLKTQIEQFLWPRCERWQNEKNLKSGRTNTMP